MSLAKNKMVNAYFSYTIIYYKINKNIFVYNINIKLILNLIKVLFTMNIICAIVLGVLGKLILQ